MCNDVSTSKYLILQTHSLTAFKTTVANNPNDPADNQIVIKQFIADQCTKELEELQ